MNKTQNEITDCLHEHYQEFCIKCGNIIKPERFEYSYEIYPLEILKKMQENLESINETNNFKLYLEKRSNLINLIRGANSKLKFRSQTFFLAVYYMDLIFSRINDLVLKYEFYSISCLLIAAKFDEIDSNIPDLFHFQKICSSKFDHKIYFTIDEIKKYEVYTIKALNYKLNYFTPYHFLIFFFSHGVVFYVEINKNNNTNSNSNLLEKVYSFAREVLDLIIEKGDKLMYHNSLHVACGLINYSREYILKADNTSFKNILNDIYEIKYEEYEETYLLIKNCHENFKKGIKAVIEDKNNIFIYINKKSIFDPKSEEKLNPLLTSKTKSNIIQNSNFKIYSPKNKLVEINSNLDLIDNQLVNDKPRAFSSQKENKTIQIEIRRLSNKIKNLRQKREEIQENEEKIKLLARSEIKAVKAVNNLQNFQNLQKLKISHTNVNTESVDIDFVSKNLFTLNNFDLMKINDLEKLETFQNIELPKDKFINTNLYTTAAAAVQTTKEINEFESVSPKIKAEIKYIKKKILNRSRGKNESLSNFNLDRILSKEKNKDTDDILHKTKKLFGSNLKSFNDTSTNRSSEITKDKNITSNLYINSNPSTIIINNNINYNTYITRNYLPPKNLQSNDTYKNPVMDLKYYKNTLSNKDSNLNYNFLQNEYISSAASNGKDIIRMKIDNEISNKNKIKISDGSIRNQIRSNYEKELYGYKDYSSNHYNLKLNDYNKHFEKFSNLNFEKCDRNKFSKYLNEHSDKDVFSSTNNLKNTLSGNSYKFDYEFLKK